MRKLADKKTVKMISLVVAAVFVLGVFGMAFTQSGFTNVASAAASESAVGVVNYQLLVAQSPDMQAYRTQMQQEQETAKSDFESKSASMNDTEKQNYAKQLDERLANKQRELLEPIYKKIDQAIERIAKKKGLSVVVDRGFVVYGGVDITSEVGTSLTAK
ncbi:MAG TPA: OmpH family outer membrane protein [Candidatus Avacidaminococcus intestinavium]|uniref:OmpH family outer membrane protein n=1 Tax=Candidatus Avacidaminococcus intestinavium TaxID=2840684 RepID=A0A9D1SKF6_9FIRM|nr:OmpH family outer membrane protein [Candidatus Avacidaminococcus intestinavium]